MSYSAQAQDILNNAQQKVGSGEVEPSHLLDALMDACGKQDGVSFIPDHLVSRVKRRLEEVGGIAFVVSSMNSMHI